MSEKYTNLLASFAEAGVEHVRRNIAAKLYGDPDGWQSRYAENWVHQQEAEKAAADRAADMALATRAAEADERAADAADRAATAAERAATAAEAAATSARLANKEAKIANSIAIAAAAIAAIAIVVAICGLVFGQGH